MDDYPRADLDWRAKGLPVVGTPLAADSIAAAGWNLFDGRFMLPTMVILRDALEHDIALMAGYARDQGVSLAPHGKVTMSPQIWQKQIEAGAWGITVATAWQAQVAIEVGIARIIIANQVVDDAAIAWLGSVLDGPGPEVICQVDSVAGVQRLVAGLGPRRRPLQVLLELGMAGSRTGVRSEDEAVPVLQAVADAEPLVLAGVTCFEGTAPGNTMEAKRAQVFELLERVRAVAEVVAREAAAQGASEIILSGGGSIHFPEVTEGLSRPIASSLPIRVIIRSGCTVTHDHGGYDIDSPYGSNATPDSPRLKAALEVWAPVLSTPEPGLAIVGAGRRDLPFDLGPPTPLKVRTPEGSMREAAGIAVTKLDDQHAYLETKPGAELSVGDTIGFGVAHPCSAFDRWRFIPVVDPAYDVLDVFETHF